MAAKKISLSSIKFFINITLSFISFVILLIIGFMVLLKYILTKEDFENLFSEENSEYILPQVMNDLITNEELNYILEQSNSKFTPSTVVSGKTGNELVKNARDSETAWLSKNDPIIRSIMLRVAKTANKDIDNCEDLQVVRYKPGGYYNEHHDSCCDESENCKNFYKDIGQRVRTCVIYLSDDFEGGATRFPKLNIEIKPPKKSAILFHPMDTTEQKCHPKALHAGTPVTSGTKIIANVWIRQNKYNSPL